MPPLGIAAGTSRGALPHGRSPVMMQQATSPDEIELQPAHAQDGMARPSETEVAENAADDAAVAEETLTGFRKFLKKLSACFWELEEHLADLFGLNDSKYQTYVDEYFDEIKRKEDREAFERWEEAERQKELDAKLAEEQAKLEGGEGEDVGLTSAAAKAAEL